MNVSKYGHERHLLKNRPRKILSLEERVQAIRMFEQTPVYQRVATAFQCSWEQIKNIVHGRDKIMTYYARCQTITSNDLPNQIRKKKIIFLGNVVFEYIKRLLFYGNVTSMSENQIRERALEFRDAIEIEQFYPNSAWFHDFMHVFNIDFSNRDNILLSKPPPKSLDCQNIIDYCQCDMQKILNNNQEKYNVLTSLESAVRKKTFKNNGNKNKAKDLVSESDDADSDANSERDDWEEHINEDEEGETIDYSNFEDNEVSNINILEVQNSKSNSHVEHSKLSKGTTNSRTQTNVAEFSYLFSTQLHHTQEKQNLKKPSSNSDQQTQPIIKVETPVLPSTTPTVTAVEVPSPSSAKTKAALIETEKTQPILSIPVQIFDADVALTHLLPLQDYALAEEDFVAINLLEKLASHYNKDLKRSREIIKNANNSISSIK